MKKYTGNVPEGFELAFELREMYGSEWSAYTKETDPNGRYLSIKVIANTPVEYKANYWFAWDRKGRKIITNSRDAIVMKSNKPDLYKFVRINLENNF
jgi:hypothetical protein